MGLFVYISKAGCPTCETYKDINFDKLTKFITQYTDSKIKYVKVVADNVKPLMDIHMSLIRTRKTPSLFYIDDFCLTLNIPSLELSKIDGPIFNNSSNLCNWILSVSGSNVILDISEDFFNKSNPNMINQLKPKQVELYVNDFEQFSMLGLL